MINLEALFYVFQPRRMKLPAASCGVSKRNCAVALPAFALTSFGAVRLAFHPYSKLQGIQGEGE